MSSYPKGLDLVTLNGQQYAVDPEFGETSYVSSAQQQFNEEDRQVFWASWTQRAFHNGERMAHILSKEDVDAFRYHDGEGVDVGMLAEWGEVKIQPALSRSFAVQSATMPMAVSSDGTTLVVGLTASPWVKTWTVADGWVSASSGLSAAVTDIMAVGSTFYAVSGGVPKTSTDAGATWTAITGMHVANDTTNTSTAANMSDLATGYTLADELDDDVTAHLLSTVFHISATTATDFGGTPATEAALVTKVNLLRSDMISHFGNATVHYVADTVNADLATATTAATDTATAQTLINLLKTYWNTHQYAKHSSVVGLAYANGDVYLLKSGTGVGRVYNHTQDKDVSNITGSFIAGYRENIYWGADSRLYLYNGRSVTLYNSLPSGYIMTGLIPYRGILFILGYFKLRTGKKNAIYYILQGTENHLYAVGDSTTAGIVQALAGYDDEIFFASPKRGGADRYDYTNGGVASGPATGTAMVVPFKSMALCEGYLWIGRYDNAVDTDGVWQADVIVPSTYRATGWITTPSYDFNYPNQQKLYRDIRVEHKALTTGQSIVVAYSLDMGANWVTAVTSNTVGATSATTTLSNIKANSIKLKATLTAGASATTTPTLTKLVVRGAPVSESKWMWRLKLRVLPRFGGNTLFSAVKAAYAAQAQLDFIDTDESTYKVIISDCQIVRTPSKKDDLGYIIAELREV